MKTRTARNRIGHRTAKSSRLSSNGNGRVQAKTQKPAFSSQVRDWLSKPKHNLVGGKWVPAASGKTFDVFNPAEASVIARVPDSDKEDINRAVSAARRAFESGPWRRLTPSERGKLIWKIGDIILENADELAELESGDNRKPRAVARGGRRAAGRRPFPLHGRLGDQDRRQYHSH